MDSIKNNKILALLFVGVLMGALDISIVGPAIPAIEKTIETDKQLISWIFSIYVLSNLVGISLMARLSDIFGRRKIYMLSLMIFALGSLMVSLSHNFSVLLEGRAIQGFGASGIFPVASAVVGDIFPPEKRGRVLGLIGAVFGLAFILGPIIAGVILRFFVWNDLFLINIPIAVILIYGSSRLLSDDPVPAVSAIDWKGILLMGIFLASFTFGINQIKVTSFYQSMISKGVLPYIILAVISFIVLIISEKNSSSPIVNPRLFLVRQIRLTGFIAIGTGLFQASFVFLPSMAIALFAVTPSDASFMLLPVVIATTIGSPVSGRMLDKFGSRKLIIAGLSLATAGFLFLSFLSGNKLFYYTAGALLGLGLSVLSGSALRYIMLNEVPATERASTQGLITIFISIGQITGSAFIGAIIASSDVSLTGYKNVFIFISIVSFLLAVLAIFLKKRNEELETVERNSME